MSFVSNGGKFKLYAVPNGLLFSTPTQPRFSHLKNTKSDVIIGSLVIHK
jgi:hypothetical protein